MTHRSADSGSDELPPVGLCQLLNITTLQAAAVEHKVSVHITFAVRDGRGYLLGADASEQLRRLNLVEFSFYLGFPVLQIAERMTHTHTHT